ncbi:MAG: HNH endonuclease [Deltaproteobacteria bacterium]|nr:HNH endonuclease [Deltaproteobacteria bacterium]
MRPVRRGASPLAHDYDDYTDAKVDLVSRLGGYCSYCERPIATNLAVEHIQPKALSASVHLIGRWENFLLACVNCNSTKSNKDVVLGQIFLPDRDNTFIAFSYTADGKVAASPALTGAALTMAKDSLNLTGLDKSISVNTDENGKMVALDRVSQRMQAWATAEEARAEVEASPANAAVQRFTAKLAHATGFFSIWMTVFAGDQAMRTRLVNAFEGSQSSGCFHQVTGRPVSPSPNLDGLQDGGKL